MSSQEARSQMVGSTTTVGTVVLTVEGGSSDEVPLVVGATAFNLCLFGGVLTLSFKYCYRRRRRPSTHPGRRRLSAASTCLPRPYRCCKTSGRRADAEDSGTGNDSGIGSLAMGPVITQSPLPTMMTDLLGAHEPSLSAELMTSKMVNRILDEGQDAYDDVAFDIENIGRWKTE